MVLIFVLCDISEDIKIWKEVIEDFLLICDFCYFRNNVLG